MHSTLTVGEVEVGNPRLTLHYLSMYCIYEREIKDGNQSGKLKIFYMIISQNNCLGISNNILQKKEKCVCVNASRLQSDVI